MRFPFILLASSALLAGCAVGPDYSPPEIAVSDAWLEAHSPEPVDPHWWTNFGDPVLTGLIERGLAESPGIAEAQARVAEARALREAAQGGRLPEGGLGASASENRVSENAQFPVANIPGFPIDYPLYDVGFDASWEIDLWGGTGRAVESAAAMEEAATWGARDVQVTLVAELARTYVDYRAAQANVASWEEQAEAYGEVARLTRLLHEAGEANRITADRATTEAGRARAELRQAQADVASAEYGLAVLVGVAPEALLPELQAGSAPVPAAPEVIASGVRSELLARRPDIRRAERELAAATANIGVATAELYPSLSLVGGIGLQAQEPGDLAEGGSLRYSVGPSFRWPLFSLGRIRAQVRAADARAEAAAARYEAAIVGALGDSENAANRFAAAEIFAQLAALALTREETAYGLAALRTERGEDSLLALAEAEIRLAKVRQQDIVARAQHSSAAIALYKALGGGWEAAGVQASR